MPIATVADFRKDGDWDGGGGGGGGFGDDGRADGEKLPAYGPGGIYHEKQIGNLCAVHCLNNLMQGPVFNEVQLAEVAQQLDAAERRLLGGAALGAKDGSNVRDDGFFNVEVIRAVLMNAGFQMELIRSQASLPEATKNKGYVFNRKEHWFSYRRIGQEWFDLNSCLRTPKHFTDAELASNVSEALKEGYAVFAVKGSYPVADLERDSKKLLEAVRGCGRTQQSHCLYAGQGHTLSSGSSSATPQIDPDLLAAAEADPELAAAIAASLQDVAAKAPPAAESMDEIRRKRLARFG